MAQKNETPALILAFLLTVSLVSVGFWWFRQARTSISQPNHSTTATSSTVPEASTPPQAEAGAKQSTPN